MFSLLPPLFFYLFGTARRREDYHKYNEMLEECLLFKPISPFFFIPPPFFTDPFFSFFFFADPLPPFFFSFSDLNPRWYLDNSSGGTGCVYPFNSPGTYEQRNCIFYLYFIFFKNKNKTNKLTLRVKVQNAFWPKKFSSTQYIKDIIIFLYLLQVIVLHKF